MAILKVSRMGHPVLRQRAREILADQVQDPDIQRLVEDMVDTMIDYEGIGLAAPQVFQPLRVIAVGLPDADPADEEAIPLTMLFNPVFTSMSEETVDGWEGCLSIPEVRGVVPRAAEVEIQGLDGDGRPLEIAAHGFFARVLQHEVDHLDGVLFLDRMENLQTLTYVEEYQRYWAEEID